MYNPESILKTPNYYENKYEFDSHSKNHASELDSLFSTVEQFDDPSTRLEYFSSLSGGDFIDLVQLVHAVVRTGNITHKDPFDGKISRIAESQGAMELPDERDKEELLIDGWQAARHFLNNESISVSNRLDYAALTVAGTILYTHPFLDGNGRTSRSLSYLISQGSDVDVLQEILSESATGDLIKKGVVWNVVPRSDLPAISNPELNQNITSNEFTIFNPAVVDIEPNAFDTELRTSVFVCSVLNEFIERHTNDAGIQAILLASRHKFNLEILEEYGHLTPKDQDALTSFLSDDEQRSLSHIGLKEKNALYMEKYIALENSLLIDAEELILNICYAPSIGLLYAKELKDSLDYKRALFVRGFIASIESDTAILNTSDSYKQLTKKDKWLSKKPLPQYKADYYDALKKELTARTVGSAILYRDIALARHRAGSIYWRQSTLS